MDEKTRKKVEEAKKKIESSDIEVEDRDNAIIEKITPGKDGKGIYTFLRGFKFPMKSYPSYQKVNVLRLLKKLIPWALNIIHPRLKSYVPDPNQYCPFVRELHRVLTELRDREVGPEDMGMKKKWTQIRDVLCMILEYDLAYRLRVQDILPEIDMDKVKLDEGDRYYCDDRKDYKWGYQQKKKK